jgi:hypothetical protein
MALEYPGDWDQASIAKFLENGGLIAIQEKPYDPPVEDQLPPSSIWYQITDIIEMPKSPILRFRGKTQFIPAAGVSNSFFYHNVNALCKCILS